MLIFLGGIIIIFLYITRLASREKFFFKKFNLFLFIRIMFFGFFKLQKSYFFFNNLKELYIMENFLILLIIVFYLLIALFLIVKISENFKGSLVKQY